MKSLHCLPLGTAPASSASMLSPLKQQRASDTQQADQVHIGPVEFRDNVITHLTSRIVDNQTPQAATLKLRPSLQKVHDDLLNVLSNAVQLRQNASLLLIGEPGIGKSLVSRPYRACSCLLCSTAVETVIAWILTGIVQLLCHGRTCFNVYVTHTAFSAAACR